MKFEPQLIVHKSYFETNPIIFEDAVTLFYIGKYCGYEFTDLFSLPIAEQENHQIKDSVEALKLLWEGAKYDIANGVESDMKTALQTGICCYQNYVQVSRRL